MAHTVAQAIAHVRHQSQHGPSVKPGMCKQQTRIAYAVPSDGSASASEAWSRTRHKHPAATVADAPRGALVWWTGGSKGHGHVGIKAGNAYVWSVDIKRPGRWDKVPIEQITRDWPGLRLVGWSEDIDGVRVVTASTRWSRTRARLLAALDHPDARGIKPGRKKVWAAIATIRAAIKATPKR